MQNFRKHTSLFLNLGCLVLVMVLNPSESVAQTSLTDSTAFQAWYSSVDARSTAMANASVADPLNFNRLDANPALIPFDSENKDLSVHTRYNRRHNIATESVTASLSATDAKKLLFGGTLIHNSPASIPLRNARQLRFTQYSFDVAYGQMLTSSLSMGIKLNANYGKTVAGNLFASNASLGIIYAPSAMISYGLVYKGTGYQNRWLGSGLSYYKTDQGQSQVIASSLPQRLEIGATLRFPSFAETPDFVLSFSNEKLFGKPGLVYRGGVEIYLFKKATLRGGYFHSSFVKGGRMGFGLLLDPINIHYAYSHNNLDLNGRTHLLSITLDI